MASRFRVLAAASALALPAAALLTLLPGVTAAQATPAPVCAKTEAAISFADGDFVCQSQGLVNYLSVGRHSIVRISAGTETTVLAEGLGGDPLLVPGQCREYPFNPYPTQVTVIVFG